MTPFSFDLGNEEEEEDSLAVGGEIVSFLNSFSVVVVVFVREGGGERSLLSNSPITTGGKLSLSHSSRRFLLCL